MSLAAVPASAIAAPPQETPITATAAALGYQPRAGAESIYRLRSVGTAAFDYSRLARALDPNRGTQSAVPTTADVKEHAFDLSASLHVRLLEKDGSGQRAAMRLQDVQFKVDGVTDTRSALLETEFSARIGADGSFQELRFPVQFPSDAALAIRGLVEPLQVVFGAPGQASWSTTERSAEGVSNLRYQVIGRADGVVRLSRVKTAALRALPEFDDAAGLHVRTRVQSSTGEVEWLASNAGLKSMTFDEKLVTQLGGRELSHHQVHYTATLATGALAPLSRTTSESDARLADESAARTAFYRVEPQAEKMIGSLTAATVLPAYTQTAARSMSDSMFLLTQYTRKHPAEAAALVSGLAKLDVNDEATHDLVGRGLAAIAHAGHLEAQQALVELLGNASSGPSVRELALEAMLSIPMPERFVPAAVWRYREALPGAGTADSPLVAAATNVYGALGGVDRGVAGNTDEVLATLGARLRGTRNVFEQRMVLVALGNVGDYRRALEFSEPFFTSREEILVMRAFETFARAGGDDAFAAFAERFKVQNGRDVRLAAIGVAQVMPPSLTRARWAAQQARLTNDEALLSRLIDILGRDLKTYPENQQALRDLLSRTRDRSLRKTIYMYAPPAAALSPSPGPNPTVMPSTVGGGK